MNIQHAYIFILCPPYAGSTVLWQLISTAQNVSPLPDEGEVLPEIKDIMRAKPWDSECSLPWKTIKDVWEQYWDHTKPFFIEKSPPNLIRTQAILKHFDPAYFIIMVRNPYAHCEGLMRRNGDTAKHAAEFSAYCLRKQAENTHLRRTHHY